LSPQNRAENAREEFDQAQLCLQEATTLHRASLASGAVTRAYFAVFHAARALLLSLGIEPRSHRAVVGLLGQHFVRTNRLPSHLARLVSRLQRDREDADYLATAVFTLAESEAAVRDAAQFLASAQAILDSSSAQP
jgi:hypothetical protein